jgi:hypothetical protein
LTRSGFRIAALLLLAALLATNFYRAATQSIVHDEALTWQLYLAGPASMIFQHYDANHHFLATLLFRISTTLFGQSEFAIRLPTVLAGAWFYWTVFRLCGLVLGEGWLFLLGCAVLTLNPILLDFLVAARGYGLAMAGLFWALYQMLAWFHDRSNGAFPKIDDAQIRRRLGKAALGCSIAVATNLTFIIPVFIVAAAFCVLILRTAEKPTPASPLPSKVRKKGNKPKPEVGPQSARTYAPLIHFLVPVAVLAVAFLLAAPIDLARSQDFYVGSTTAVESLRNLMNVSFAYGVSSGFLHGTEEIWSNFALIFLPAMTLAALIAVSLTKQLPRSMPALAACLASLVVVGSAILLIAAHLVSGMLYPVDRTGVYFVPLATFAALGFARTLMERPGLPRSVGFAVAILLASFAIEFAAQWNVKSFLVWRYDADTKRIFEALETAPKPTGQIRMGVSWVLEPALNYYRVVRNATWLAPVERDGFDGLRQFYAATPQDQTTPLWASLKKIYQGPVSATALAVPQANQ